jgi:hypothetical protein
MWKNKKMLIFAGIIISLIVIVNLFKIIHSDSKPALTTSETISPITSVTPAATATLPSTSRWYDPALLSVGDTFSGWQVIDKQMETYGKGSKTFTLAGETMISGTFTVNYEEDTYNSNQIVFVSDEGTSNTLPQPLAFKGTSSRMVLHVENPEDRKQFGPPGSKGHVTLTIQQYLSVYADILEGVSDSAKVIQVSVIDTTPPPQTEVPQSELMQALQLSPLTPFQLSKSTNMAAPATFGILQDWLKQLNKQYMTALSPFNTKRISPEQKAQIHTWLLLAFTEAKANELAASSLPASGIHYLVANPLLDLFPYSEVKEIKNQTIQNVDIDTIRYTGVYILSGTQDAQFTYTFKQVEEGVWKLDQVEIKLI